MSCSAGPNDNDVSRRLHSTTDAMVWAEEWCKIAREIVAADDGRQLIDQDWMAGWFANLAETVRIQEINYER